MNRIGILLPARDEEGALPLVLAELPRGRKPIILVVDNGSKDGTGAVARAAGAAVVREERQGYGRACLTGIAWFLDGFGLSPPLQDADVLVFLDADHSDYP